MTENSLESSVHVLFAIHVHIFTNGNHRIPSTPSSLNLDSSLSIPILLTATSPSPSGSPIEFIVGQGGPSGKFYQQQAALSLLDTLRTGGPSAKIALDTNATDDQQEHFQRFHSRLQSGDLVRFQCFTIRLF
jgi:hypothetical protein